MSHDLDEFTLARFKRHNPLAKLQPKDPLLAIAWADALRWGIGDPEANAVFQAATGRSLPPPPTSPIEQAVDEATGVREEYVAAFAEWFTLNVWGPDVCT